MRTYLIGRFNCQQPCDIALPASALSVSRKHLELSVTDDGRYYVVHLHPQNTTSVLRSGKWQRITQDYVLGDESLRLGDYETTARHLLDCAGRESGLGASFPGSAASGGGDSTF